MCVLLLCLLSLSPARCVRSHICWFSPFFFTSLSYFMIATKKSSTFLCVCVCVLPMWPIWEYCLVGVVFSLHDAELCEECAVKKWKKEKEEKKKEPEQKLRLCISLLSHTGVVFAIVELPNHVIFLSSSAVFLSFYAFELWFPLLFCWKKWDSELQEKSCGGVWHL